MDVDICCYMSIGSLEFKVGLVFDGLRNTDNSSVGTETCHVSA